MLKFRGYLFIVLFCLSMMLYWPFPVIARFIFSERVTYAVSTFWGDIVLWLVKVVLGIDYKISGIHNLPDTPCVLLSKHQSALDIFVLLRVVMPQTWVLKKELLKIPCFGWAIGTTDPIAIDRSAGRKALKLMLERGVEKLQKGYWVVLYPEGTRTLPGEKGSYKSGGVILAQRAKVDIVPIALNTGLFWQKGKGFINKGTVDIVVGEPISTEGRDAKTVNKEVEAWIEENSLAITLEHPYYLSMKDSSND